jgi:hypothetical protein
MRVGIVSKIWGRPALTRAFLSYYASLEVPGVEIVGIAAVSLGEDPGVALTATDHWGRKQASVWSFVNAPNQPLADKGNAACEAMRPLNPDLVINLGSDDFVSPEYVRSVVNAIESGADYVVPSEVYFYEPATHRACRQTKNHGMKAGAAMSARLLEKVGWRPWKPGGHFPDTDLDSGLRSHAKAQYLPAGSGVVLDVKAEGVWFTSFDQFRTANRFVEDVDPDELLSNHFPGLLEALNAGLIGVPV